jgi:uncharacterized membrane protein YjfL (UPF0719 family)
MLEEASMLEDVLATLAYVGLGTVLIVLGYLIVDLLTPEKLGDLIFRQRKVDAALLASANVVAIGLILVSAILTSADDTGDGLLDVLVFGGLGLVLLALSYLVIDLITPGNLGQTIADDVHDPGVYLLVAVHLAIGGVIAASLT